LHRLIHLAKVTQVIDRLTSSIDHVDLEADGCEVSLWETKAALGVVTSRFFSAPRGLNSIPIDASEESLCRVKWKDTFGDELLAMSNTMGQIDAEHGDGCPADGSAPREHRSVPAKVPVPFVAARIEKPSPPLILGVNTCQIRAFMVVVSEAGQRQVTGYRRATVLCRYDVINLEGKFVVALRHLTVFATAAGAPPNQFA
jgi:hypothetical protein